MAKLIYTPAELAAEHDYATRHTMVGYRLHGGFDAQGQYISPRTKHRWPAVHAWQTRLQEEGWALIDVSTRLLSKPTYPSHLQQKLLLKEGVGQTFWDALTITGLVEARGNFLVEMEVPHLQDIIVENIEDRACGHLNKGLLVNHGLDEAGDPKNGIGGHDTMWFAVRDKVFGKDAYPIPPEPGAIGRPDSEQRYLPMIPEPHEKLLLLLMNILMIEVRAEKAFDFYVDVLRDPELFTENQEAAEEAAVLVDRIRQDEAIHVGYLQTVISEVRRLTIRTLTAQEIPGDQIIDPVWEGMVQYQAEVIPKLERERLAATLKHFILSQNNGSQIFAEFSKLDQAA